MKLLKITAAIAATAAVATAQAATISGGGLNGVATDVDTAVAVSAVAIVASTQLIDGLRAMQGFDAACTGNVSILCAPSISSAELRSILNNSIGNLSNVNGGGTDLSTASGITGKTAAIKEYAAAGVMDALNAFNGSGAINGLVCGQSSPVNISNPTADDAASLAGAATGAKFGFVHATELDGSLGFIKLDGVAPNAISLASSNYNLVSNLSADGGVADSSQNGTTVGVVSGGAGVASHAPFACSSLNPGAATGDTNGGSI
jgi:hypothetical protein